MTMTPRQKMGAAADADERWERLAEERRSEGAQDWNSRGSIFNGSRPDPRD